MNSRNVVLFLADCVNKSRLHVYGNKRRNTAFLDKMRQQGAIIESLVPDTLDEKGALLSLLTGTPDKSASLGLDIRLSVLPKILENKGYLTGAITDKKPALGDSFRKMFNYFYSPEDFGKPDETLPFEIIEKKALEFMEKAKEKPFFLLVYITRLNGAFYTKDRMAKKYLKDKIYSKKQLHLSKDESSFERIPLSRQLGVEKDLGAYLANFDTIIHETDKCLEAINSALSEKSISHKTLTLFAGLRGLPLGEHGNFFLPNSSLFNEELDSPLLIKGPEIKFNTKVSGLARSIDIFPTILDYLEMKPEEQAFGTSLLQSIRDGKILGKAFAERRYSIITQKPTKIIQESCKDDKWKLLKKTRIEIEYFPGFSKALGSVLRKMLGAGFGKGISEMKFQIDFFLNKKIAHSSQEAGLYYLRDDKKEEKDISKQRPDEVQLYSKFIEENNKAIAEKVRALNSKYSMRPVKPEIPKKTVSKPSASPEDQKKAMEVMNKLDRQISTTLSQQKKTGPQPQLQKPSILPAVQKPPIELRDQQQIQAQRTPGLISQVKSLKEDVLQPEKQDKLPQRSIKELIAIAKEESNREEGSEAIEVTDNTNKTDQISDLETEIEKKLAKWKTPPVQ